MKPLISLAFLLLAFPAAARSSIAGYSVELVGEGGTPLTTFQYRGDTYVMGGYGQRYNVRVVNRTGERVEAVITVDGRDAISGDNGSFSQRGYVLDPYGSVTVEGFRQNLSEVAVFRFTAPGDSYAGRRGSVRNNGVVGVAVFREKARAWRHPQPIARRYDQYGAADGARGKKGPAAPPRVEVPMEPMAGDDGLADNNTGGGGNLGAGTAAAEAAPMRKSASLDEREESRSRGYGRPAAQNLGTQYGESMYSSVVEVPFQRRGSSPDVVLSLYYDDADGLRSKGVPIDPPRYSGEPNPFPADRRFAPAPR